VAAFADERVFLGCSYSARPVQDLCALLYTWLAAAHSAACAAPWLAGAAEEEELYVNRSAWLQKARRSDRHVASVAALLRKLLDAEIARERQHDAVREVLQGIVK
jgi:hypothetical protein